MHRFAGSRWLVLRYVPTKGRELLAPATDEVRNDRGNDSAKECQITIETNSEGENVLDIDIFLPRNGMVRENYHPKMVSHRNLSMQELQITVIFYKPLRHSICSYLRLRWIYCHFRLTIP